MTLRTLLLALYKVPNIPAMTFSFLVFATSVPAHAEYGVMPGVKHLALIIANEDYDGDGVIKAKPSDRPPEGMLKDLENPCRDARMFRDKLIASNWRKEEVIFRCNVDGREMRQLITDFRERVVNSTDTVAVFFFSGHGAQFSDAETSHSFLFGVRAKFNLGDVAKSLRSSPRNTSFVANQAVDLDELVGNLGIQSENAVLVILDACRDNPLYGQISEMDQAPKIGRLSANEDFRGVVVAYSTTSAQYSSDGPGKHSPYSAAWASLLQPARTLDSMLNHLNTAMEDQYKALGDKDLPRQVPSSSGRFSGDWCLWACPREQELAPVSRPATSASLMRPAIALIRGNEAGAFHPVVYMLDPDGDAAGQQRSDTGTGHLANVPSTPVIHQQSLTIFDVQSRPEAAALRPGAPMRFDVFWCDGGADAEARFSRARDLAQALGRLADTRLAQATRSPQSTTASSGQLITSIRLRRLSPGANVMPGYRYTDDIVLYDADDEREVAWSKLVAQISDGAVQQRQDSGRTPGYISIFVCRAQAAATPPTVAYLQVPSDDQRGVGRSIMAELGRLVPSLRPAKGIETRTDGPLRTEVRFYADEDRDTVFATTARLETILGRDVRIQYMPRLLSPASRGHMEIWFGRDDPPAGGERQ